MVVTCNGDQRGFWRGKRVRGRTAGVGGRHAARPRTRASSEHLGFARGASRPESDDRRRSRGDQKSVSRLVRAWGHEVALAADGPSALALAESIPARVRHRRYLNAGHERDRAGSSSPPAVSSGAAPPDRPQWLSRTRTSATGASPQVSMRIWSSRERFASWSGCSEPSAPILIRPPTDPDAPTH